MFKSLRRTIELGAALNQIDELKCERDRLRGEITKLKRACEILYYGSPELHQVAENAYSGCPSTERDNPHELKEALEARDE